jgi:hypothetical protein
MRASEFDLFGNTEVYHAKEAVYATIAFSNLTLIFQHIVFDALTG